MFECRGQHVQQLVELERFGDELRGPPLDSLDRILDGTEAGHDDADHLGVALESRREHLGAIDTRQTEIGEQDVERKVGQVLDRCLTALGLDHPIAVVDKPLGRRLTERRLIFDQQQMYFFFNHLVDCANILTPALGRVKDLARRELGAEPCPELLGADTEDSGQKCRVASSERRGIS